MKITPILFLLSVCSVSLYSQDSLVFFLNENDTLVSNKDFYVRRVITRIDENIFSVRDYYSTGILKLNAQYYAKNNIEITRENYTELISLNQLRLHGKVFDHTENGKLKTISEYKKGKLMRPPIIIPPEDEVFFIVEKMPKFQNGGNFEFRKYIASVLTYPAEAAEKKIQGRVFVQFAVGKDGYVQDVKIIRGIDPLLDAEAKRVVESSPQWEPGMQKGKPVKVQFTFPIVFAIPIEEKEKEE